MLTGFLVDKTQNFDVSIAFAGCSLLIAAGVFVFLVRERDIETLTSLPSAPGEEQRYREAHGAVWQELIDAVSRAGIRRKLTKG
jgi:hypothetical protein